jgi:hypothetical protein
MTRGQIASAALMATTLFVSEPAIAGSAETTLHSIQVDGTRFHVTLSDGSVLLSEQLIGAVLTARIGDKNLTFRIDGTIPDPRDPSGEILLHHLSTPDPVTGEWHNLCKAGPDGLAMAIPFASGVMHDGHHVPPDKEFRMACTSDAEGKCLRFGYKPWVSLPDGTSLQNAHQACVRAIIADYCGTGTGTTRDNTLVDIADSLGIQPSTPTPEMEFEAAWTADGAVCVHHVRIPENTSLEALKETCPRLRDTPLGETCTRPRAATLGALMFIESVQK